MAYSREYLETVHDNYKKLTQQWEFLVRSYYGGKEYKLGNYLHQYNLELDNEYDLRLERDRNLKDKTIMLEQEQKN